MRLPNPAMAVNPDTSTALPVLRDKMLGVRSSAKRFQDMDAISHADADDQRQRHDVRRIEGNVKPAHQPDQPERADADRQQ